MFAPKVAKPQQTKETTSSKNSLARQSSPLVAHRPGQSTVEQALMLQRTIRNQATLRLLAQPTSNLIAREAKPGVSWDFTKIPLFPPDRADLPQLSSSLAAMPPSGAIQAKLVVGQINDPLEHEADRVADQVMRMPDSALSIGTAPPQISRKCADCEEEEARTLQPKSVKVCRSTTWASATHGEPERLGLEVDHIVVNGLTEQAPDVL
jgi:hypothetical protein